MNLKDRSNSGLLNIGTAADTNSTDSDSSSPNTVQSTNDVVGNSNIQLSCTAVHFKSWDERWTMWTKLKAPSALHELQRKHEFYRCMSFDCSYTTSETKQFLQHLWNAHPDALHICSYCLQGDFLPASLLSHSEKHRSLNFQCPSCVYRASTPYHVLLHTKKCHGESKTGHVWKCVWTSKSTRAVERSDNFTHILPFRCTACAFQTRIFKKFHLHQAVHPSKTCFYCQSSVSSFNSLIAHLKYHDIYFFHCFFCLFGSDNTNTVFHHICLNHPGKEITFYSRTELEVHTSGNHGNEVRTSDSHLILENKSQICSVTKNKSCFEFLCVFCNYMSPKYEVMFVHLKKIHQSNDMDISEQTEDNELDVETGKWVARYLYAQQLVKNNSSKDLTPLPLKNIVKVKTLQCPMCLWCACSFAHLFIHISCHLQYQPYKCSYCSFGLASYYEIQEHIGRSHSNEPISYECFDIPFVTRWIVGLVYGKDPGKWPPAFSCKKCSFRASKKRTVLLHDRRQHRITSPPFQGTCIKQPIVGYPITGKSPHREFPDTTGKQFVMKSISSESGCVLQRNSKLSEENEPCVASCEPLGRKCGVHEELQADTMFSSSPISGIVLLEKPSPCSSSFSCPTGSNNSTNSNCTKISITTEKSKKNCIDEFLSNSNETGSRFETITESSQLTKNQNEPCVTSAVLSGPKCGFHDKTQAGTQFSSSTMSRNIYGEKTSQYISTSSCPTKSNDVTNNTCIKNSITTTTARCEKECSDEILSKNNEIRSTFETSTISSKSSEEEGEVIILKCPVCKYITTDLTEFQNHHKSNHILKCSTRKRSHSSCHTSGGRSDISNCCASARDSTYDTGDSKTYFTKKTEVSTYTSRYGFKPEPIDLTSVFITLKNPFGNGILKVSLEYYKDIWFSKPPKVFLRDCITFSSIQ